jgi:hypothetical protein
MVRPRISAHFVCVRDSVLEQLGLATHSVTCCMQILYVKPSW